MTSKIDLRGILLDHFDTLRDESTNQHSAWDIFVMFGVPCLCGLILGYFGVAIRDDYVGTFVSIFSIFAGLLINVLVLIYSLAPDRLAASANTLEKVRKLLRQTFANISYSIVISLLNVIVIGASPFFSGNLKVIVCIMTVALSMNFLFSLMMVLKRLHVLLKLNF